jgi:pantoate--beta-alanine ligase
MKTVHKIAEVREAVLEARGEGRRIGFVPTMGALHAGHIALIEEAVRRCDFVVLSIFVNPSQFGPGEDFDKYPRDIEGDESICRAAGVDLVFVPSTDEMYPGEQLCWVNIEKLGEGLCGLSRPGHFRGVATVCCKFFNIVMADAAFFGQKDAQQSVIIRRMVSDLNLHLEIITVPTVRESDGLAMSSRNKYLSAEEREAALLIYKSLRRCDREVVENKNYDCGQLKAIMRDVLSSSELVEIDYAEIVALDDLTVLERVEGEVLAAIAAKVGGTRLIDNIKINSGGVG